MRARRIYRLLLIGVILSLPLSSTAAWAEPFPPGQRGTQAEAAPAKPADRVGATVGPARMVPSGMRAERDCPAVSRFTACDTMPARLVLQDFDKLGGKVVGGVIFQITLGYHTESFSNRYRASVHVKVTEAFGRTAGTVTTLTATCNTPCKSSGSASGPTASVGQDWNGILFFQDAVMTDDTHISVGTIVMQLANPSFEGQKGDSGRLAAEIRCDDTFRGKKPGCVVRHFIPTMTEMAQLPTIAASIRSIQQRGGVGVPNQPLQALTRMTDPARIRQNRNAVCGPAVVGRAPKGMQCDEYPFASTLNGGTATPKEARGVAWVPAEEQQMQGGFLAGFYAKNRVQNGDHFYVRV
ncbi:NucA/NucB deoxyribonuclease domain-containing protein [Streptomyces sp. NBC_00162]|uniref:NucA/NucB deoxyribonuclease domain-containing protein n=1 Tax=Streptomyces sp. NBC_00162 TaxID=2903629 RepID=UPI00214B7D5F|nr:NucA/NucB deoxyribonuclease domain-containing protein [Streptomyces sp. NBC_00162]UUU37505.1 NucA/NucB deoxyribonuclease domain-containing protein [Streptomyces sp. NBC_00162]